MGRPKVTTQSQEKRVKNFQEVSLGYSKRLAIDEAKRCPQCSDPVCIAGCPLGINIPGFIRLLREGNVAGAYEILKKQSFLPSICGRICSAPCEAACILNEEKAPIGIRELERYASDYGKPRSSRRDAIERKGKRIAIIGAGPAGLTAAGELANQGFQVTIFESLDKPGGVLRYGIPEFRIPKKVLDAEIEEIKNLGVKIETNFFIGRTSSLDDLRAQGFKAILLTTGAGIPKFMDLPGANLGGVYYGEEFLMRVNQTKPTFLGTANPDFVFGDKVAVIGSGNTALDCARAAVRYGKQVTLVFRRTEEEMRVRALERELAKQENIVFESLVKPLEIMENQQQFVGGLKCVRMDYAAGKKEGDWQLMPVPESEFIIDVDTVVIAIGHQPNSYVCRIDANIALNKDGTIKLDKKTFMTSMEGVFAAGNVAMNAGPVVEAMASGKTAAGHVCAYLQR